MSIALLLKNAWSRLSPMVSILGGVGDVYAFFKSAPLYISVGLLLITMTAIITWVITHSIREETRRQEQTASHSTLIVNPTPVKAKAPVLFIEDYILQNNVLILDIKDAEGKKAIASQRTKFRCRTSGANKYNYRLGPDYGLSKFSFPPGKIESITKNAGKTDVIVEFATPCALGEVREIYFSCEMDDLFLDAEEYYYVDRNYESEGPFVLEIKFPVGRSHNHLSLKKCVDGNYSKLENFEGPRTETVIDGRTCLSVDLSCLQIMDHLSVRWHW